jgi:hypothetical protein
MVEALPTLFLQEHDRTLIHALAEQFRLLTRPQISELLGISSVRALQARLQRLREAGYLSVRLVARMGAARQYAYHLGPKGVDIFDDPTERRLAANARTQASQLAVSGLRHRLFVDSVHIRFLSASRDYAEYRLLAWVDQYSPWWNEMQAYGLPAQADGYAEYLLLLHFDSLFAFFLEVDCDTENRTVLKSKIDAYAEYAASGMFQERFAATRPFRVLFITTNTRRLDSIMQLCGRSSDPTLFWATTMEDFSRYKLLAAYWQRAGASGTHSLLSKE